MRNLDLILTERTDEIKEIQEVKQGSIEGIQTEYQKELKKLNKWKIKETEKVSNESTIKIRETENEYNIKLAQALLNDLESDYKVMQDRCKYGNLDEKIINKAIQIRKTLDQIKEKESREILTENLTEDLRELVNQDDLDEMKERKTIVTYIIPNNEGCYVLTPIKNGKCPGVIQSLENQLIGIINIGKITEETNRIIRFNGKEFEYLKEFLMFEIESTEDTNYLAKQLARKLNNKEIQPKKFAENNLEHKAIVLDYSVFKTFLDSKSERELTRQTNKHIKPVKISKKYEDPLNVIQEYQKLNNQYKEEHDGENMNISEILLQRVGGKTHSALYYALRGHLTQGTIQPDQIQTHSNLIKYSK